jgi:hypothetical protein
MRISPIRPQLYAKLQAIRPSRDGDMAYFPCQVRLTDGRVLERVYVQPLEPYRTHWGVLPADDPDKHHVPIEDIADLEESPLRLPPQFADELYRAGESGMGYTIFQLDFRNGASIPVVTGNAVDFVPLPPGTTVADIVRVRPHEGRNDGPCSGPTYYWSIFVGVLPAT